MAAARSRPCCTHCRAARGSPKRCSASPGAYVPRSLRVLFTPVHGMAGVLVSAAEGQVVQAIALESTDQACIAAIYVQRNPDKSRHIGSPP